MLAILCELVEYLLYGGLLNRIAINLQFVFLALKGLKHFSDTHVGLNLESYKGLETFDNLASSELRLHPSFDYPNLLNQEQVLNDLVGLDLLGGYDLVVNVIPAPFGRYLGLNCRFDL